MESHLDWHQAKALLEWQIELGATEAILDAPVNRFELTDKAPAKEPAKAQKQTPALRVEEVDPVAVAEMAAAWAQDLAGLKQAMAQFEHCQLKRGARQLVFADEPRCQNHDCEGPGRTRIWRGVHLLVALDNCWIGCLQRLDCPVRPMLRAPAFISLMLCRGVRHKTATQARLKLT